MAQHASALSVRSDVDVAIQRVRARSALAWVVAWPVLSFLFLAVSWWLIWLRADAQGRGTVFIILMAVVVIFGVLLYKATRRWRGIRLCNVVPPRALLTTGEGTRQRRWGGLFASAPLHLYDGRLLITDFGREYALAASIDSVQLGILGRRWCCYAVFTAGRTNKRVHAVGRLPKHIFSGTDPW